MTSKTAKASLSHHVTDTVVSVVTPKPQALALTGPMMTVMHKMTALIRKGYMPLTIEYFPASGHMHVTLEIGNPDPAFTEAAETDLAEAMQREEFQRQRDIEAAAEQLVKDRERAARKAEMDAKVSEAEAALAALKAAALA
jgi:hypothetical protein